MSLPLSHRPGHAQADFGEADGYIAGKKSGSITFAWICRTRTAASSKHIPLRRRKPSVTVMLQPLSFFGGVPKSILYDNTRLAVAKIVKGGQRLRSQMFAELQSHYLFDDRFGRPGKGNDKGKVEGLVG